MGGIMDAALNDEERLDSFLDCDMGGLSLRLIGLMEGGDCWHLGEVSG